MAKSAILRGLLETIMPKRKRPEEKPEEQFKRFIEVAKEHDVDDGAADRVFKHIATKKKTPAPR